MMKIHESFALFLCLAALAMAQRGSSSSSSSSGGFSTSSSGHYYSSSSYSYTSSGYSYYYYGSVGGSDVSIVVVLGVIFGAIGGVCVCFAAFAALKICLCPGNAPNSKQQANQRAGLAAFATRAQRHSAMAVASTLKLERYTNFNGHFSQDRQSHGYTGSVKIRPTKVSNVYSCDMKGKDKYGKWATSCGSICVNKQDHVDIAFVKRYTGNREYNVFYEGTGHVKHGSLIEITGTWTIVGESCGAMTLSLSMPVSETKCFMQTHTQYV